MKKSIKLITLPAAMLTAFTVYFMQFGIVEGLVANASKLLPVGCFWGFGDVEQPKSVIEKRRRLMGVEQ